MNKDTINLLYIWDGYCGWCYGFSKELNKFLKNHPELPVSVLPGGLFTGDKSVAISNYPHISGVNQRIQQLTGVEFGVDYNQLLEEGSFILDSEDAGKGFVTLKHFAPERQYQIAYAMMKEFYQEGKSLSDPETYVTLAKHLGLNSENITAFYQSEEALTEARKLFEDVHSIGVNSYPTLILQKGEELIKIGGGVAKAEKLEENLQNALETFNKGK